MAPAAERRLGIRVGALCLDGRLAVPEGASSGCVVCHPHPLYGGDMHSPVVVAVTRVLQEAGFATLRFDFRGTGDSDGIHSGGDGEVDDARAAVEALVAESGVSRVAVAGYSFGAWIALRLAAADPRPAAVAAIAPPLAMVEPSSIPSSPLPLLALAGDRDTYCPAPALQAFAASRPGARALLLPGADHFFGGREKEAAGEVARFLAEVLPGNTAPGEER